MVRQAVTLVGRDPECHLVLSDDPALAPRHARFEERGAGVFLTSLAPEQPVLLNDQPVLGPVRLSHDDRLAIGQTRIQFQDIIAPHQRLRPSHGLLQPMTLLMAAAIVAVELVLLLFLIDWPTRIIRPETEAADLARAEEVRAGLAAENDAKTGTVSAAAAGSVVVLPGTEPDPSAAALPAAGAGAAAPASVQVLAQADFTPADTNVTIVELPPVSAADPLIEEAQRMLAEASAAAQFADYARAFRLLNQIHQNAQGFLPAHVEHARLLEVRGNLDEAQQRWSQILGLAPAGSPFHAKALRERERLAQLQQLQSQILQTPENPDLGRLPRAVLLRSPEIQKMPADADIAEMRVLNATLELAPNAKLFKDAAIQVFITFYDADANGDVRPTRAITTPSPLALGNAFADRRSVPLNATYVVPQGLRAQELRETGRQTEYYGYAIHVYAGQILQDAAAKPKKLLPLPIHVPSAANEP